ncbi:hypothetical protein HPP92_005736 [Vanilla planifolia]|uniref:Uncharacterized protein n=1 Tax=Vanilla planifolia TaxID=51239 RepID=A0A835VCG6_VANPL|nr:hypothetical protein HPP92_005736 [Vanilla planifolia]
MLLTHGYNGLKPGWTRVSFAYYLTKEEFAFILDAIEFIASYGHRFLSLYHLDWMTGDWTINRRALGHHLLRKESLVWLKDGHRKKKSHYWFGSYMKDAQRIARSLPSILNPSAFRMVWIPTWFYSKFSFSLLCRQLVSASCLAKSREPLIDTS